MRLDTKQARAKLVRICQDYHPEIPLRALDNALKSSGLALAEEGFILCGEQGRATFGVDRWINTPLDPDGFLSITERTPEPSISLAVQWYKMPSGRFEINAYLT